jgi:hypothetical protein
MWWEAGLTFGVSESDGSVGDAGADGDDGTATGTGTGTVTPYSEDDSEYKPSWGVAARR